MKTDVEIIRTGHLSGTDSKGERITYAIRRLASGLVEFYHLGRNDWYLIPTSWQVTEYWH